jgi:hypothetical protein
VHAKAPAHLLFPKHVQDSRLLYLIANWCGCCVRVDVADAACRNARALQGPAHG